MWSKGIEGWIKLQGSSINTKSTDYCSNKTRAKHTTLGHKTHKKTSSPGTGVGNKQQTTNNKQQTLTYKAGHVEEVGIVGDRDGAIDSLHPYEQQQPKNPRAQTLNDEESMSLEGAKNTSKSRQECEPGKAYTQDKRGTSRRIAKTHTLLIGDQIGKYHCQLNKLKVGA